MARRTKRARPRALKHRKHRSHRKHRHVHRGGVTPLPASYFQPKDAPLSASSGHEMMMPRGQMVRPAMHISGGGPNGRNRMYGGFVPSVMEGFVAATSKYVTPIALMAMYRLIHRPRKTRRHE